MFAQFTHWNGQARIDIWSEGEVSDSFPETDKGYVVPM